jgi:hypothetical protein
MTFSTGENYFFTQVVKRRARLIEICRMNLIIDFIAADVMIKMRK